jgi:hypothetical protein
MQHTDQAAVLFGAGAVIIALLFWAIKAAASHAAGHFIWTGAKRLFKKPPAAEKEKNDDK